jgi:hypothetical protein
MERKCEFCDTEIEVVEREGYPQYFNQNGDYIANKWVCQDCATKLTCDKCGKPVKVAIEKKNVFLNDDNLKQTKADYIDCAIIYSKSPAGHPLMMHPFLICDACIHEMKCNFCGESLKPNEWRHGVNGMPIGPKWICNSCAGDLSKALEEPSKEHIEKQVNEILVNAIHR